jgi:hypothetical protein
MAKKKSRFRIGQPVYCKATCKMEYLATEGKEDFGPYFRTAVSVPCKPFNAVVVGAAYKRLGQYQKGFSKGTIDDPYDYEQASLEVNGTAFVWQVREGMTNRVIEVLDGDVEESCLMDYEVPWAYREPMPKLTDMIRGILSYEAKHAPRDKSGRFVKCVPATVLQRMR